MDNIAVGNYIRKTIKEKGITQECLAERLNQTPSAVSQKLNGKNAFSIEDIVIIAEMTGCTEGSILHAGEKPESEIEKTVKKGLEAIKTLEAKGYILNDRDQYGLNALDYAISQKKVDVASYLIDNNWYSEGIHSDLGFLTFLFDNDLILYLNKKYDYSRTAEAKKWKSSPAVITFPELIETGTENSLLYSKETIFERLSEKEKTLVRSILSCQDSSILGLLPYGGIDPNRSRYYYTRPQYYNNVLLDIAVELDDADAFQRIACFPIDEDNFDRNIKFYLDYAIARKSPNVTKYLLPTKRLAEFLEKIAKTNDAEYFGKIYSGEEYSNFDIQPAFLEAVKNQNLEMAKIILPNASAELKNNVLNYICPDDIEMIKAFLDFGAEFSYQSPETGIVIMSTLTGAIKYALSVKK